MSTVALRRCQAAISLRLAPLAKAATVVSVDPSRPSVPPPIHRRRPTFRSISRSARRDEAGVFSLDARSSVAALDEVAPPDEKKNPIPDFRDSSSALESKTTSELVRGAISFGLCRLPPIVVRNAEPLLSVSRRIVGDGMTDAALKSTLFGQFCAGENFERDVRPAMRQLEMGGIGSILDFAAEDDGEGESRDSEIDEEDLESQCDQNLETFKRCVRDAAALEMDGYAAVKVTALGDPKILERASRAISQVRCQQDVGPVSLAALTEEETELLERTRERGRALAKEAAKRGTRLLVDAEQRKFQPAIDDLVLKLQREFNSVEDSDRPVVYNTYQCYLKDAPRRLETDLERSERLGYHLGAKLVRGAYMEHERASAEAEGRPSPVHDTIEDTHRCFDDSVEFLLRHAAKSDRRVEVMLATHNRTSVERAIEITNDLGIHRNDPTLCFAQLYGMQDVLTFNLGRHGYRAYKYVPYGEVKTAVPYLIRRANENSTLVGDSVGTELRAIVSELSRRLFAGRRGGGSMP